MAQQPKVYKGFTTKGGDGSEFGEGFDSMQSFYQPEKWAQEQGYVKAPWGRSRILYQVLTPAFEVQGRLYESREAAQAAAAQATCLGQG
jgi:hypothetical protein